MPESATWRVLAPLPKVAIAKLRGQGGSLLAEWAIMLDPAGAALVTARRFADRKAWERIGTVEPNAAAVRFIRELAQRPELAEIFAASKSPFIASMVEERAGAVVVREEALPVLAGIATFTPIMFGTTRLGARIQNDARRAVRSREAPRQSVSDAGCVERDLTASQGGDES